MSNEPAKPSSLRRAIAFFGSLLLTVSAITPASSMFIIIPGAILLAGTGIFYSMLVAGVIGLIMAFVYSELGSAYPSAGGEYVMVGKILGLWPSYITIFLNGVVVLLIPTVLALGAGDYFSAVLPGVPPTTTALIVIGISTIFGLLNIRLNAWITGTFLFIELACVFWFVQISGSHIVQPFSIFFHPMAVQSGSFQAVGFAVVLFATATTVFAFNGYEEAVYLTEEIKNVRKIIPRVIIAALFFSLIFESVPTVLLMLGSSNLSATVQSAAPFRDLTKALAGNTTLQYMSAGISLAVFNACIVNMLLAARFIFSTGRDGFWGVKFGNRLARVNPSQGTPWYATLFVGVVCAGACYVPFNFLLVLTGTGLVFVYFILCISVLVGRRNNTTRLTQFRLPLFPIIPVIGLIALAGIGIANWLDPSIGRPSIIAAFVEIGVATLVYIYMRVIRRNVPLKIVDPE